MLKEMTLEGTFNDKEAIAIDRIITHRDRNGKTQLAFGRGKDSTVVYDLAKRSGIELEPHYHFTTVDPPELVRHILKNYPEIIIDRPNLSMFQLIVKKGCPPTRMVRYCCEELKEYGGRDGVLITGVRWEESKSRAKRRLFERCTKHKDTLYLNPIIDWTEKEVWEYIRKYHLPYCSLYDEGWKRIGCIMCPKARVEQREAEAKRWPKFYNAYMRCFERMLKVKNPNHVLQWRDAKDVMYWWMYETHDDGTVQCEIFG